MLARNFKLSTFQKSFYLFNKTLTPQIVMPNNSKEVEVLIRKLNTATKTANDLQIEVESIKKQIDTVIKRLKDTNQSTSTPEKNSESDETDNQPSKKKPKLDQFAFDMDDKGYVVAYTDGACENNGKPNAKAGYGVWFGDNHPLNISEPLQGRPTNNHAEIKACTSAIRAAKLNGFEKVKIVSDSKFTIDCMNKWVPAWEQKGWKTAKGEPVKNETELKELINVSKSMDVKYEHVAAHRGTHGNEEADRLARDGARRYR